MEHSVYPGHSPRMGDFTADKLFLFILFALPGAVAIKVYTLWRPTPQKDWKESITDAVIYSGVGLAVWFVLAPSMVKGFVAGVIEKSSPGAALDVVFDNGVNLILYTFATPVLLSSAWFALRLRVLPWVFGFDHPTRTAWDWVFSRKEPVYILFHLKTKEADGRQVVRLGYFNGRSYVTTYPFDAEIYVERVHMLNPDGTPGMPIPDTNGMLIRHSECERLEF